MHLRSLWGKDVSVKTELVRSEEVAQEGSLRKSGAQLGVITQPHTTGPSLGPLEGGEEGLSGTFSWEHNPTP